MSFSVDSTLLPRYVLIKRHKLFYLSLRNDICFLILVPGFATAWARVFAISFKLGVKSASVINFAVYRILLFLWGAIIFRVIVISSKLANITDFIKTSPLSLSLSVCLSSICLSIYLHPSPFVYRPWQDIPWRQLLRCLSLNLQQCLVWRIKLVPNFCLKQNFECRFYNLQRKNYELGRQKKFHDIKNVKTNIFIIQNKQGNGSTKYQCSNSFYYTHIYIWVLVCILQMLCDSECM